MTSHNLTSMPSPPRYRAILKSTSLAWAVLFAANPVLAQIPKPTDAPRPMTPGQSAAAFRLPDGFRMEVVASEPLIDKMGQEEILDTQRFLERCPAFGQRNLIFRVIRGTGRGFARLIVFPRDPLRSCESLHAAGIFRPPEPPLF